MLLRQDNADLRLSEIGHDLGLLPERNYQKFHAKNGSHSREKSRAWKKPGRDGYPDSIAATAGNELMPICLRGIPI